MLNRRARRGMVYGGLPRPRVFLPGTAKTRRALGWTRQSGACTRCGRGTRGRCAGGSAGGRTSGLPWRGGGCTTTKIADSPRELKAYLCNVPRATCMCTAPAPATPRRRRRQPTTAIMCILYIYIYIHDDTRTAYTNNGYIILLYYVCVCVCVHVLEPDGFFPPF